LVSKQLSFIIKFRKYLISNHQIILFAFKESILNGFCTHKTFVLFNIFYALQVNYQIFCDIYCLLLLFIW